MSLKARSAENSSVTSGYLPHADIPDPTICWEAIHSRDRRFDGRFFVAAASTGLYCRSICPVPFAKPSNVVLFACAAAAEAAGYRPCRRCNPQASPGTPAWPGTSAIVSRALRLIWQGAIDQDSVEMLAERVGVGSRHLRRLFVQHLGASPIQIVTTHRTHFARKLIDETDLPMTQIALSAGFRSIRQFNHSVKTSSGQSPTELRRLRSDLNNETESDGAGDHRRTAERVRPAQEIAIRARARKPARQAGLFGCKR